jgi:chemotaxis protein MotA
MEKGSGVGIVLVLFGTFAGAVMKGVSPAALFTVPAAFLIVLVSSFGATFLSFSANEMKNLPKYMKIAFMPGPPPAPGAVIGQIVEFADRARREGLLALEDAINQTEEPFLRKGLQMAVDGAESEVVRDTLDTEVHAMKERHKLGSQFMTQLGIYAPTFGIIGAVFGLIATLSNLDDPEKLGHGIAAAFVATFWGVFSANGVFLPVGRKLQRLSQMEADYKQLIIEGVLSIQAGSSPRVVDDLLQSFLPPAVRLQLKGDRDERQTA